MPEEEYEFTPVSKLMQADEIEAISKIFVAQGVNKIRLTGALKTTGKTYTHYQWYPHSRIHSVIKGSKYSIA
jgi:hypothetical protein